MTLRTMDNQCTRLGINWQTHSVIDSQANPPRPALDSIVYTISPNRTNSRFSLFLVSLFRVLTPSHVADVAVFSPPIFAVKSCALLTPGSLPTSPGVGVGVFFPVCFVCDPCMFVCVTCMQYCGDKFSVEPVDVTYDHNGETQTTPLMSTRTEKASVAEICSIIGVKVGGWVGRGEGGMGRGWGGGNGKWVRRWVGQSGRTVQLRQHTRYTPCRMIDRPRRNAVQRKPALVMPCRSRG